MITTALLCTQPPSFSLIWGIISERSGPPLRKTGSQAHMAWAGPASNTCPKPTGSPHGQPSKHRWAAFRYASTLSLLHDIFHKLIILRHPHQTVPMLMNSVNIRQLVFRHLGIGEAGKETTNRQADGQRRKHYSPSSEAGDKYVHKEKETDKKSQHELLR